MVTNKQVMEKLEDIDKKLRESRIDTRFSIGLATLLGGLALSYVDEAKNSIFPVLVIITGFILMVSSNYKLERLKKK